MTDLLWRLERRWTYSFYQATPAQLAQAKVYRAFRVNGPKSDYFTPIMPGFRFAYRALDQNADVFAREPYRTILAAVHWWMFHRWVIEHLLIRMNLLRSPVEGDLYENYRFDPPDLWGTPLRRHETWQR